MTDWTDTAKRMAAHPRWKPDSRMAFYTTPDGEQFPDLTDWATTGIEWGLCFELAPTMYVMTRERGDWCVSRFQSNRELREKGDHPYKGHFSKVLGQALGEFWLELVG